MDLQRLDLRQLDLRAFEAMKKVVSAVTAKDLERPTPCPDWHR